MADIYNEINAIKTAVYGEEVRGSIVNALEKLSAETGVGLMHDRKDELVPTFESADEAQLRGITIYGASKQLKRNEDPISPSNPAPIITAASSDGVTVVSSGKNLLSSDYYAASPVTVEGVTFTANPDGSVTVKGTSTNDSQTSCTFVLVPRYHTKSLFEIGKTYTVTTYQGGNKPYGPWDDCWLNVYVGDAASITGQSYGTFTWNGISESANCNIEIRVRAGATVDTVVYPMVRIASNTDVTWESPRAKYSIIPLSNGLPGIPVTSGGNYKDEYGDEWICDTVDFRSGKLTRRCGIITLNGSQTYSKTSGQEDFYIELNNLFHLNNYSNYIVCDKLTVVATHGIVHSNANSVSGYSDDGSYPNRNWLYFKIDGITTVSDLGTWLRNNPITIVYPLNESVVEDLTDAQLKTIYSIYSHRGIASVFAGECAGTDVDVYLDYMKYITNYIDSKISSSSSTRTLAAAPMRSTAISSNESEPSDTDESSEADTSTDETNEETPLSSMY